MIEKLEHRLSTRVITYVVSLDRMMEDDQADLFFEHLKKIGYKENLTLFLFAPGGQGTASLRIATIIREYCKNLQILVPSCCASAATILALSGDKIIMSPAGYLTAIDASLPHPLSPRVGGKVVPVSTEQIKRIVKFLDKEGPVQDKDKVFIGTYRTLFRYIHPLVVGEIDRGSSFAEMIAIKLMKMHPQSFENGEKIVEIARKLVNDYPTHSYPILYQEAQDLGLPVEKADRELSELMWELVKLYGIATQVRTTNLAPTFYHHEEFPIMIETTGYRTVFRYTYNKRFNPILKTGDTENNFTGWYSITASSGISPYKISPLDVPTAQPDTSISLKDDIKKPAATIPIPKKEHLSENDDFKEF